MRLERLPEENEYQHHKRLVYGKLVDKTLADMDYSELAEVLYGKSYSSDVSRRMMYGSRYTLELLDRQREGQITSDSVLDELDEKKVELQKERQKFFDQRREYSKIVSQEARYEHMIEKLCDAANHLDKTVGCMYRESFYYTPDNTLHCKVSTSTPLLAQADGNEAVLVFSDWHYGLKTENAFNEYNTDICRERVTNVTRKVAERLLLNRCTKLHIVVLGDLVHGAIHTSARVASEELVCDQLMQASEILAQTIELLSSFVEEIAVYVTYGNHARTIQNKGDSVHRDNMERLVPWWLKQRLSTYDNIVVRDDSGTEFIAFDVCGHQFCAAHGDQDSIKTSSRLLPMLLNRKLGHNIEYILLGDKHHRESFEELGVTSMLCGALCGADDYANSKRLYSTPSQLLLIVNQTNGVDGEYRIKCA